MLSHIQQRMGCFVMPAVAQVVGFVAVVVFLLSYQQKTRKNIIILNVTSRCLYILQYLLLGAFSGAVLDVLGALISMIAGKKHTALVKKYQKPIIILSTASFIAAGVSIAVINRNILDLFSLAGVLLHTGAFWLDDERIIRWVSLMGSPFWFIYNFFSRAYGSSIGDILSMCSIIIAMIRHRNTKSKSENS